MRSGLLDDRYPRPWSKVFPTWALALFLLLLPAVSAETVRAEASAVALDGVTSATSKWIWGRWTSDGVLGKPQIGGQTAFDMEVWAYDETAPDPMTGETSRSATRVHKGPGRIEQTGIRGGFDVSLFAENGTQKLTTGAAVVRPSVNASSAPDRTGAVPFPAPNALGDRLGWTPAVASTLDAFGAVRIRLWEVDIRIHRPDGGMVKFTSGRSEPEFPASEEAGGRELLITIESGRASLYGPAAGVHALLTGPVSGTLEGRYALHGEPWSDSADGRAPSAKRHEFALGTGPKGMLTTAFTALDANTTGNSRLTTRVVQPAVPASTPRVVTEPVVPIGLWATAVGLGLSLLFVVALWVRQNAMERFVEQMRAATIANDHQHSRKLGKRLLRTRHGPEAAATIVQATLQLDGPRASMKALESKRIRARLEPAMARLFAALIRSELGQRDLALAELEAVRSLDPSLASLVSVKGKESVEGYS